MKRKLNENDEPEPVSNSFQEFGLDSRILQAIASEKYTAPTPVQAKAIPLALEGRDILARAKTGSGKTAAYVIPALQSILRQNASDNNKSKSTRVLILVPTKELADQVTKSISTFSAFCQKEVDATNLMGQMNDRSRRVLLQSTPAIVVATPARALQYLNDSTLKPDWLQLMVIDEADLILSYGYDEDLRSIVKLLPRGVQSFLASATLTDEVGGLKELFCNDPVVLDLKEEEKKSNALTQYVVKCAEDEKFLFIFALFKLKLIKGKCLVFVADVDRCYRVKLFLEQFGIKSCVLNSELPVNSRIHVVEEFNKNIYDIIIATDEHEVVGTEQEEEKQTKEDSQAPPKAPGDVSTPSSKKKHHKHEKKPTKSKQDREYGISRGIDFRGVSCVLNFDLPPTPRSYTHRIGRTARANHTGTALSFVIPAANYRKHKPTTHPATAHDDDVLAAIADDQAGYGAVLRPYVFAPAALEGFRYRVGSALSAVTPGGVREARIRELRSEMLKSDRLKRHLEENPADLRWLRHDAELKPARVAPHMRHVPEYLMAGVGGRDMQEVGATGGKAGDTGKGKIGGKVMKGRFKGKKADPLKTFKASGKK